MPEYLMLRHPSANRTYAGEAERLSAAELKVCVPRATDVAPQQLAGVDYLGFSLKRLDGQLAALASQSSFLGLFENRSGLLAPIAAPELFLLDEDLLSIPKYPGKTNEQFTRLLFNVTLAAVSREATGPRRILDPLAGRGTTLSVALRNGHHAFGVESDAKSFEQLASFYKTYLRRKRIKHHAAIRPVRRDGKLLGQRFEAQLRLGSGALDMEVYRGDARESTSWFGSRRFDAIVTDAPYGVAHGATTQRDRDRSPARLLAEAIPGWAEQLMRGGALGISWNTFGLAREELAGMLADAGLLVCSGEPWDGFWHRVDSSIRRDLLVAVKPLQQPA